MPDSPMWNWSFTVPIMQFSAKWVQIGEGILGPKLVLFPVILGRLTKTLGPRLFLVTHAGHEVKIQATLSHLSIDN